MRARWPFPTLVLPLALALGCGSDPATSADDDEQPNEPAMPSAADLATAEALGRGDGTPGSVSQTVIYDPSLHPQEYRLSPTGLAWNSIRPAELWVTLRDSLSDTPCTEALQSSCPWLWGYAAIITTHDDGEISVEVKRDDNAWHFMRRPTSIAFGPNGLFATCGEARTANFEDEGSIPFNGPVLWSSDPQIFGASGAGTVTTSTHIDMLHSTPYCMGIAHERENVYWAFNGDAGALDRYDFREPHEPGADDHKDGALLRYALGQVLRVPEVPSHLAYEASSRFLYAADTGNGRIVRLDTLTGTQGAPVTTYDHITIHHLMVGAQLDVIVPPGGDLGMPSGLALYRNVLFVSDHATSRLFAFDLRGRKLRELDTGLPSGALGAFGISPQGQAYFTDVATGLVIRIDPY